VAGIFGAALLPTWEVPRPPLELSPFCGVYNSRRFNITTPFAQSAFTYATDTAVIIRIPGMEGADHDTESKRPDGSGLWWQHDSISQWRRWPARKLIPQQISRCPECGDRRPKGGSECEYCDGEGIIEYFSASSYRAEKVACECCKGRRWIGDYEPCQLCGGFFKTSIPSCQPIGSMLIGGYYDRIIRELPGVRFAEISTGIKDLYKPDRVLLFRSDVGDGILCGVTPD